MKRIFFISFLLVVLLIQNISSQTLGDLFTERNGGFSMSMPRGWQPMDVGLKYSAIIGNTENGFTPNFTFVDDIFAGSISEYIDATLSALGLFYSDLIIINRGNFSTGSGLQGEYVLIQGRLGEISVRQKAYVFPNVKGDGNITITSSAPSINGERFDAIFDECVKTFRWTR